MGKTLERQIEIAENAGWDVEVSGEYVNINTFTYSGEYYAASFHADNFAAEVQEESASFNPDDYVTHRLQEEQGCENIGELARLIVKGAAEIKEKLLDLSVALTEREAIKEMKYSEIIAKIDEYFTFFKFHSKNLTKTQEYKILELQDLVHELVIKQKEA